MTDDLLQSIRQRLDDAEADATALRAAIAILEGDGTHAPVVADATRPRRVRRRPAGETSHVVSLGVLLSLVAEHPGQTNSWLAKHTGADQSQLLTLLKEAERNGEVRREGQRRGTRWWAVTDEDRIAERVAELDSSAGSRPS